MLQHNDETTDNMQSSGQLSAVGQSVGWTLNHKNWALLPSAERDYLVASGSAPMKAMDYKGHSVLMGVWFGSVVFDLRTLTEPLNLPDITDVSDHFASVDFDALVWRASACPSSTWNEFVDWVGSVTAEFDPILRASDKRHWRIRKCKRNYSNCLKY